MIPLLGSQILWGLQMIYQHLNLHIFCEDDQNCLDIDHMITEYWHPLLKSQHHECPYTTMNHTKIQLSNEIVNTAMGLNGSQPASLDFED